MRYQQAFGVVLGLSGLAVVLNCGSKAGGTATGGADASKSDGGVVVKPNVIVLTDAQVASATVTDTEIILPAAGNEALANLPVGAVLVSAYQDGFIRKLTALPQGSDTRGQGLHPNGLIGKFIKFLTSAASLTDAIANASFDWSFTPSPFTPSGQLFAQDGGGLTIGGALSLAPSFEVSGQITDGVVQTFNANDTVSISLTISPGISFPGPNAWKGSQTLASFGERFIVFVGPIPIVGKVVISLSSGYSVSITDKASVSIPVTCSLTHSDVLAYDAQNGWNSNSSNDPNCSTGDTQFSLKAGASAKLYLSPRLQLVFLGIGGPNITAQVGEYAKVDACPDPSSWSAGAYLSASVGANFGVLGIHKQFSTNIGELDFRAGGGTFMDPLPITCGDGGTEAGTDGGGHEAGMSDASHRGDGGGHEGGTHEGGAHESGARDSGKDAPVCTPACTGGMTCQAGECACPASLPDLCDDTTCTNTQTDVNNCGACDTPCEPGQGCSSGLCTGCETGDTLASVATGCHPNGTGCTNMQECWPLVDSTTGDPTQVGGIACAYPVGTGNGESTTCCQAGLPTCD